MATHARVSRKGWKTIEEIAWETQQCVCRDEQHVIRAGLSLAPLFPPVNGARQRLGVGFPSHHECLCDAGRKKETRPFIGSAGTQRIPRAGDVMEKLQSFINVLLICNLQPRTMHH